ncbi:MAG: ABC transporter ATP-binding protein [Coriobacteriia bacterium]|nr:ABC transporter ATP-binding protein [Coriobacteriia bacterium]
MIFELKDLEVNYGVIRALKGISLEVETGEIVTLIGANGAGKSTTLRTISGLIKPKSGQVIFDGADITHLSASKRVSAGISQAPEGRRIFAEMTTTENLEMGAFLRSDKAEIRKDMADVFERFPILGQRSKQQAGTLSGGEQQMLAIGRALMAKPRLMLLDEPSLGLAPIVVKEIFAIIREINQAGTTIFLVEQNARMALKIADRGYVLETGEITLSGTGEELAASDEVQRSYLGRT